MSTNIYQEEIIKLKLENHTAEIKKELAAFGKMFYNPSNTKLISTNSFKPKCTINMYFLFSFTDHKNGYFQRLQ